MATTWCSDSIFLWQPAPTSWGLQFCFLFDMASAGRWRDLLPLPLLRPDAPTRKSQSVGNLFESVRAKRNRVRRNDNLSKVNEVISAINEMAGFSCLSERPAFKAQRDAQTVLMRSMASLPRSAERPCMREAIHELLHLCPSSEYMPEEGTRSTVHPFDPCAVSLPDCGADPFDAAALIDEQGRDVLERFEETTLACDEAAGMYFEKQNYIKPYLDEVFQKEPETYVGFIKDLFQRGMIEFRESAKSVITPFFVTKKNGRLRLVLDCRKSAFCSASRRSAGGWLHLWSAGGGRGPDHVHCAE